MTSSATTSAAATVAGIGKATTTNIYKDDPCTLFSITQYQCTPLGGRVTCWPLERVFRQCGEGKPSIEVTNRLVPASSPSSSSSPSQNHARSQPQSRPQDQGRARALTQREEEVIVDPKFIANPPKARNWSDYRGQ